LTIIEMGKGIFGAEAAAQYYFKKRAKDLTMEESAKIAACLPNPKEWTVVPLHKDIARRSKKILKQMNNIKDDKDIQELIK
jgi:monofunctional glycosyltransferase